MLLSNGQHNILKRTTTRSKQNQEPRVVLDWFTEDRSFTSTSWSEQHYRLVYGGTKFALQVFNKEGRGWCPCDPQDAVHQTGPLVEVLLHMLPLQTEDK